MRLHVITIGKTKNPGLKTALADYVRAVNTVNTLQWVELKDQSSDAEREADAFYSYLQKHELIEGGRKRVVLLEVSGPQRSSEEFAAILGRYRDESCQDLSFLIGGAYGFSDSLRKNLGKVEILSLSRLTFTHELARVILCEQIYRALHILKGSKYHHG